tara:strand:- start:1161 stop:1358 length:198 start_codon:yes stop_codon:yes gene_type:complete
MFQKYKLTTLFTFDNSVIDSKIVEYKVELERKDILKLANQYLRNIGYGGKDFKISLKKVKNIISY